MSVFGNAPSLRSGKLTCRSLLPGLLLCLGISLAARGQEKPAIQIPPAPPSNTATADADSQSCPPFATSALPVRSTIAGRLGMLLESNRLKPGKKIWLTSVYPMDLHGCMMAAGAPITGVFTAASSAKNGGQGVLAIDFKAVDCIGHTNQPLKTVVVGVFAPNDDKGRQHNQVSTELHGSARQVSDAVNSTGVYDAMLDSAFPDGVILGSVVGYKDMQLKPQGGPACTSQLVNKNNNVVLLPGTILLLAPESSLQGK